MHRVLPPLLSLLAVAVAAGTALADPAVQEATQALAEGNHKRAISLFSPPPLTGAGACVLAEALLLDKQARRAILYLDRCHRFESDADVRRSIARLKTQLRKQSLAALSLALRPDSATARVDSGYGEEDILLDDEDLWLPKGKHRIEVSAEGYEDAAFDIVVDSADRMLIPLSLQKKIAVTATVIDLGADAGADLGSVTTSADQRPKKFKTLLAERYRRAPDPKLVAAPTEESSSAPWPAITAAGGLVFVGVGAALHYGDHRGAALASYGAGAGLLGIAAYLFFSEDEPARQSVATLSVSAGTLSFALGGSW